MLFLSIAIVISMVLITFKGVHIKFVHEMKYDTPSFKEVTETKETNEAQEDAATIDDMVKAVQDIFGGLEDE